jgi:hypothetical protein
METLDEPALRKRLGELAGQSTVVEQTLAGHDLRLDGHDTLLAGYGSRITTAEAGLVSQGARLTTAEASIASQGARLTAAEGTIATQGASITAAEADILAQASRLDGHDSEIAEIKRRRVTTEAQFAAALGRAETIIVAGTINFVGQYDITIPTRIVGEPGAKMVFASTSYFINVAASLTLQHITIEGPGSSNGYCLNIGGTTRAGVDSWVRCLHVRFKNMGSASVTSGSSSAPLGPRTIFFDCDFDDIGSVTYAGPGVEGAISHNWHLGMTVVDSCRFNRIYANPMYFGQSGIPGVHTLGEALFVTRNQLTGFKRIGVETFSAARAFIENNYIEEGTGSWASSSTGNGMGISAAGGLTTVRGNYIRNMAGYGMEIYRIGNLVVGNTIDGLIADNSPGNNVGIAVDNCFNTLLEANVVKNIRHFNGARYALKVANSEDIIIKGGYLFNVSYGAWISSACERVTIRGVDMFLDFDPAAPALGFVARAVQVHSGVNHKIIDNIAALGPTLSPTLTAPGRQGMYNFATGTGGYNDWTGVIVGPVGASTDFGNLSNNLALP